ncbi:mariner Mos1 transposase [Trichonephila clavipes]|nr:mariner Mos1 transposase [Trichonephila clavipes]
MKSGVSNMTLKRSDKGYYPQIICSNWTNNYRSVLLSSFKVFDGQNSSHSSRYRIKSSWCLLHDNASSRTSLVVRQFLAKNDVCVHHPPYSSDFAPCDTSLFPNFKMKLKECHFEDISTSQVVSTHALQVIPQSDLQQAFDSLKIALTNALKSEDPILNKKPKHKLISCVRGSPVFSLTFSLGTLGPELMTTLFQPNPRSEA